MTYKDLLSNPRYRNWVKAGLGFKFLKEGLESFVDNEVRGLRDTFLQDICINLGINEASCKSCTTANAIPCPTYQICNVKKRAGICSFHDRSNQSMASRKCPNQICSTIHQKIKDQHLHNNPSWKNTDASQWCTNPWQIAKCYMPQGGYENKNSVTETDCSGILNVIINCLHLRNGLDTGMGPPNNICARILNMRNEVFHSATLELTDDELTSLINEMTALLQDKKKLLNDTGAQTAVVKLTELKDGAFNISTTHELEIDKAALNAIKDLEEETKQLALIQDFMKEEQTDIEEKQTEVEARQRLVEEKQADADTRQDIVEMKQAEAEIRQNIVEKKQADAESRQNIVEKKQADAESRQNVVENKQADADIRQNIMEIKQADVEIRQNIVEKKHADAETRQNIVEKKQADVEIRQNIVEKKQADVEIRQNIVEKKQADFDTRQQKEIMKLNMKLDNIRGIKDRHQQNIEYLERKKELQDQLCRIYEEHLSTIPVSPILPEIKAKLDDVFVELLICDDLVHESKKLEKRLDTGKKVKGYRDVLYKQDQKCKNVYVIADAGMGKTTWCLNLLSSWVKCYKKTTGQIADLNKGRTADEKTLSEFHIVLFASLRHGTDLGNIRDMLKTDLFFEHPHLEEITGEVLEKEPQRCLVVLDGLDEWSPPIDIKPCLFSHPGLPSRGGLHDCTVLTTTRPWKLDAIRNTCIDRAVKIQGTKKPYFQAQKIIKVLNIDETEKIITKKAEDFKKKITEVFNEEQPSCLNVPLILVFMVFIWLEEGTLESTLAANYSRLLELLISNAQRDEASGKPGRLSDVPKLQEEWVQSASFLPKCLQNRTNCKYYSKLLLTLSKLAFDALFDSKQENNLVFTWDSLQNKLLPEELDVAEKIGLLSRTRAVGTLFKRKTSLSFLHKSVQEYMAALHLVCNTQSGNCEVMDKYKHYCTSWSDVCEMENVLMFVCGMNPKVASKMSQYASESCNTVCDLSYPSHSQYQQWTRKYINEISVAHGDIYPSTEYPFHYRYSNMLLNLHGRSDKPVLNLLKTNRAHIKDLTITIFSDNSFKEIVCLLSKELQQPNYMVESFSFNGNQCLPEVTPLLSKAIPQMGELRELELHYVHLPDTASETVMDLSCCKHLEKFVCLHVEHIKVTSNQSMLKLVKLEVVKTFTLNVQIGKSNRIEELIFSQSKNSTLDFTSTFMDACNEQVQCSSKDNIVHIGTMKLLYLTKCKVHFGSGVQLDTLFVAGFPIFDNNSESDICDVMSFTGDKNAVWSLTKEDLQHLTKLRHLICNSLTERVCEELWKVLPTMTQLEKLDLSHLYNSSDDNSMSGSVVQSYKHLTHLRHVKYAYIDKTTCKVLGEILQQLPQLMTLEVEKAEITHAPQTLTHLICKRFDYFAIEKLWYILPSMTQLEKLDLSHLHDSSDDNSMSGSVVQSYKHLTNLQHVKSAHIEETVCKVLGEILQQLPQLKTLEVDRAEIIPSSQHLTHLTCGDISVNDLKTIAKQLAKLTQLETMQLHHFKIDQNSNHGYCMSERVPWNHLFMEFDENKAELVIHALQYLQNLRHLTLNFVWYDWSLKRSTVDNRRDTLPHSRSRSPVNHIARREILVHSLQKLTKLETLELALHKESINLSQLCNLKKITFNNCQYLDNDQWKELLDNLPKQHPNQNLEVTINYEYIQEHTKEYIEKLTRFPSKQYLGEKIRNGRKTYKKIILQ